MAMIDALTGWLFFTVFFALLPLVFDRLRGATLSWADFWGDGQVLLISAALSSESLGEAVLSIQQATQFPTILVAVNFIVVACSTLAYSDCSDIERRAQFIIPTHVMSLCLFIAALMMSIFSKAIALNGQGT